MLKAQSADHRKVWGAGYHAGVRDAKRGIERTGANLTNRMLCWNPGTRDVAVLPWPDYDMRSDKYMCSDLACWDHIREMGERGRKKVALSTAIKVITEYGCDPRAVHEAMLELDEYRQAYDSGVGVGDG